MLINFRNPTIMKQLFICTAAIALAAFLQPAQSQTVFSDNFNSYANDASLLTVWTRVTGTATDIGLAPDPDPANLFGQGIYQSITAGRIRRVLPTAVSASDAAPLVFSFDLYDVNGGTTSGRVYGEIRNSAGAAGLFAAGIYPSANVGTYDQTRYQARDFDSGGWIQLASLRSLGWHHFEFTIKGNTVDLKVDGVLDPNFTARAWNGGALYDWINIGSALTGNAGANFDNVSLSQVPEPSALVLGILGAVAFLLRRRL